jgi:hypothetical protein
MPCLAKLTTHVFDKQAGQLKDSRSFLSEVGHKYSLMCCAGASLLQTSFPLVHAIAVTLFRVVQTET